MYSYVFELLRLNIMHFIVDRSLKAIIINGQTYCERWKWCRSKCNKFVRQSFPQLTVCYASYISFKYLTKKKSVSVSISISLLIQTKSIYVSLQVVVETWNLYMDRYSFGYDSHGIYRRQQPKTIFSWIVFRGQNVSITFLILLRVCLMLGLAVIIFCWL